MPLDFILRLLEPARVPAVGPAWAGGLLVLLCTRRTAVGVSGSRMAKFRRLLDCTFHSWTLAITQGANLSFNLCGLCDDCISLNQREFLLMMVHEEVVFNHYGSKWDAVPLERVNIIGTWVPPCSEERFIVYGHFPPPRAS